MALVASWSFSVTEAMEPESYHPRIRCQLPEGPQNEQTTKTWVCFFFLFGSGELSLFLMNWQLMDVLSGADGSDVESKAQEKRAMFVAAL